MMRGRVGRQGPPGRVRGGSEGVVRRERTWRQDIGARRNVASKLTRTIRKRNRQQRNEMRNKVATTKAKKKQRKLSKRTDGRPETRRERAMYWRVNFGVNVATETIVRVVEYAGRARARPPSEASLAASASVAAGDDGRRRRPMRTRCVNARTTAAKLREQLIGLVFQDSATGLNGEKGVIKKTPPFHQHVESLSAARLTVRRPNHPTRRPCTSAVHDDDDGGGGRQA